MESLNSVTSLFDCLQSKRNSTDDNCIVQIVDTLVFHNGALCMWVCTDPYSGQFLIRGQNKCNPAVIMDAFCPPAVRDRAIAKNHVVAVAYTMGNRHGDNEKPIIATFLNYNDANKLITNYSDTFEGIVQKFLRPAGRRNSVTQLLWTPYASAVSRVENTHEMSDPKVSLVDRHVTFEGTCRSVVNAKCAAGTLPQLATIAERLAKYIGENHGRTITRMVMYFKFDRLGLPHVLFTTQILITSGWQPPPAFPTAAGILTPGKAQALLAQSSTASAPTLRLQQRRYLMKVDSGFRLLGDGRMANEAEVLHGLDRASAELHRVNHGPLNGSVIPLRRIQSRPTDLCISKDSPVLGEPAPAARDALWGMCRRSIATYVESLRDTTKRTVEWIQAVTYEVHTAGVLQKDKYIIRIPSFLPISVRDHVGRVLCDAFGANTTTLEAIEVTFSESSNCRKYERYLADTAKVVVKAHDVALRNVYVAALRDANCGGYGPVVAASDTPSLTRLVKLLSMHLENATALPSEGMQLLTAPPEIQKTDLSNGILFEASVRCVLLVHSVGEGNVWCGEMDGVIRERSVPDGAVGSVIWQSPAAVVCNALCVAAENRVWGAFSDGVVRVFIPGTSSHPIELLGHHGSVECLAVMQKKVFTAGTGRTISQWCAETLSLERIIRGHTKTVRCLLPYPLDPKGLLSAGDDATIRLWSLSCDKAEVELSYAETCGGVSALLYHAATSRLWAACSDHNVRVFNTKTLTVHAMLSRHEGPVLCLLDAGDGKRVCSAAADGSLAVWDAATQTCVVALISQQSPKSIRFLTQVSYSVVWRIWGCEGGPGDGVVRGWSLSLGSDLSSTAEPETCS